jgi:hypothetical protein
VISRKIGKNEFIVWNGLRVLIIREFHREIENVNVDIVLVANNGITSISQLDNMKFERIIIDDTNRSYIHKKLLNQAHDKALNVISLPLQGSYTLVI